METIKPISWPIGIFPEQLLESFTRLVKAIESDEGVEIVTDAGYAVWRQTNGFASFF